MPDPDTATSDEINTERISVATAFVNCRELNHEKVVYIKGTGGK